MYHDKLISPSEVMNRLGISYSTLLRQMKEGQIPHVKIGKQYRVPESYIEKLIDISKMEKQGGFHEC